MPPNLAPIADAAFLYLKALARARIPVFAISTSGLQTDENSRWYPYRKTFSGQSLDEKFINLCCGFGGDFDRFFTPHKPNVMITGAWGTENGKLKPSEVPIAVKWVCVVPNADEAARLDPHLANIHIVKPEIPEVHKLIGDVLEGRLS